MSLVVEKGSSGPFSPPHHVGPVQELGQTVHDTRGKAECLSFLKRNIKSVAPESDEFILLLSPQIKNNFSIIRPLGTALANGERGEEEKEQKRCHASKQRPKKRRPRKKTGITSQALFARASGKI